MLVIKENPTVEVNWKVFKSVAKIYKTITQNLQLKKAKMHNVHKLVPRHVAQRRIFRRTQYESYVTGDKWRHIVNFDVAWVYLRTATTTKKDQFTIEKEEKKMHKPDSFNTKEIAVRDL